MTTQQFSAPDFDQDGTVGLLKFSDYLNLFFFNQKEGLGATLKALEQQGHYQSLAEPNLIAYNNQEASFLAGGEFPVPIVQGATGTVTVVFKEFGVRLTFRPTIAGDVIRLKVQARGERARLQQRHHAPGLPHSVAHHPPRGNRCRAARRPVVRHCRPAEQHRPGRRQRRSRGVSKIPIIGYLFRSKAEREEQTELMVLVTPRLVRPLDPDEVPPLPVLPEEIPAAARARAGAAGRGRGRAARARAGAGGLTSRSVGRRG